MKSKRTSRAERDLLALRKVNDVMLNILLSECIDLIDLLGTTSADMSINGLDTKRIDDARLALIERIDLAESYAYNHGPRTH